MAVLHHGAPGNDGANDVVADVAVALGGGCVDLVQLVGGDVDDSKVVVAVAVLAEFLVHDAHRHHKDKSPYPNRWNLSLLL